MTAPYIRRESSPFLKRVLIPFWNLRIVILLAGLASNGLLLAALILITDDVLSYITPNWLSTFMCGVTLRTV